MIGGASIRRFLPWLDIRGYDAAGLRRDAISGLTVAVLGVPQGIAYALIAGLPPVMGLYASAVPALVGSLFRSSPYVITGPTNALSLLVGSVVAARVGEDPITVAVTLAVMVGMIQAAAGWLRLGALVDYISMPVVLGYITGAGVMIGIGQLNNLTGTSGHSGSMLTQVSTWIAGLSGGVSPATLAIGLGTVALLLLTRRAHRKLPHALIATVAGIALSAALDLRNHGIATVADLAPVPRGLPPWSPPDVAAMPGLLSAAFACTLLSLVESSSVARASAARTGLRLDPSVEFSGQGLANLAGGLFGSYPISGSLARSALNESTGARGRLSGVITGLAMLLVLLMLGPLVNLTPIASLAGLLVVVAADLVDLPRIRSTLVARRSDAAALLVTMVGTWVLPLHHALELGVVISLVLFLRRARLLTVREMVPGEDGRLREVRLGAGAEACTVIRVLHVEGALFFGAAGELQAALDEVVRNDRVRAVVLRLKRTQGLDISAAEVLRATAERMRGRGQSLLLVGMRAKEMKLLEDTGIAAALGADALFPTQPGLFVAMERAIARARELTGHEPCDCGASDLRAIGP